MERATALIRRFGRLVHALREESGLTQEQLAARAGMSKKHVGDIERGDVEPSLSAIECLAGAFDMSLLDLLAPVAMPTRSGRPTLPMRDWIQARESLRALSAYVDRMVSQPRTSHAEPAGGPTYRRRRARRSPNRTS